MSLLISVRHRLLEDGHSWPSSSKRRTSLREDVPAEVDVVGPLASTKPTGRSARPTTRRSEAEPRKRWMFSRREVEARFAAADQIGLVGSAQGFVFCVRLCVEDM